MILNIRHLYKATRYMIYIFIYILIKSCKRCKRIFN